jgi:hypothetical protein
MTQKKGMPEMDDKNTSIKQDTDYQVQIKLVEYGKLQDRILEKERGQQQVLILGLGSVSVVFPIILSQATQLPHDILAALLYALSIIFSALTINYVIVNFDIALATSYIDRTLSPELNLIVLAHSNQRLLDYEHKLRVTRSKPIGFFLANIRDLAAEIILLLPTIFALGSAHYLLALPRAVTASSQMAAQQLIESWLGPLSILAWVCLILTAMTFIGCTIYWLSSGFIENR